MSDIRNIPKAGIDEKYCTSCGLIIKKKAVICPKCGVPQDNVSIIEDVQTYDETINNNRDDDKSSIGLAILGFWMPLLGFILYLFWKEETPKRAKSCGRGALLGFIVWMTLIVAIIVFIVSKAWQNYGLEGILLLFFRAFWRSLI
jgi:hypothetical protein